MFCNDVQFGIQFADGFVSMEEAQSAMSLSRSRTDHSAPLESYELVRLKGERNFLCAIPAIKLAPHLNATEKELSKVEEEKELARATSRGWELLSDLDGNCLFFVSGWWSYSFCHNREVRQFHQLPSQQSNQWPPTEDPHSQSYVLGRVSMDGTQRVGDGTQLQATGKLRYLVQKLGSGTVCDLTGKERKIEIQVGTGGIPHPEWHL
jgi:protein OS-9